MKTFEVIVRLTLQAENEAALANLVLACDFPGYHWEIVDIGERADPPNE